MDELLACVAIRASGNARETREPVQANQGKLGAFGIVLVTLPYLGNETCPGSRNPEFAEKLFEIDLAFADLQTLARGAAGVGNMQMCGQRDDGVQESIEGFPHLVAGKPGMGDVQTHSRIEPLAKIDDVIRQYE
jgi:hypothetical protein